MVPGQCWPSVQNCGRPGETLRKLHQLSHGAIALWTRTQKHRHERNADAATQGDGPHGKKHRARGQRHNGGGVSGLPVTLPSRFPYAEGHSPPPIETGDSRETAGCFPFARGDSQTEGRRPNSISSPPHHSCSDRSIMGNEPPQPKRPALAQTLGHLHYTPLPVDQKIWGGLTGHKGTSLLMDANECGQGSRQCLLIKI